MPQRIVGAASKCFQSTICVPCRTRLPCETSAQVRPRRPTPAGAALPDVPQRIISPASESLQPAIEVRHGNWRRGYLSAKTGAGTYRRLVRVRRRRIWCGHYEPVHVEPNGSPRKRQGDAISLINVFDQRFVYLKISRNTESNLSNNQDNGSEENNCTDR